LGENGHAHVFSVVLAAIVFEYSNGFHDAANAIATVGFAAETTAALIIQAASHYGIPLSTTHVISSSSMGVGAVKRFSGTKWTVVARII
jgi:PiT family inorganic phosphate transporter